MDQIKLEEAQALERFATYEDEYFAGCQELYNRDNDNENNIGSAQVNDQILDDDDDATIDQEVLSQRAVAFQAECDVANLQKELCYNEIRDNENNGCDQANNILGNDDAVIESTSLEVNFERPAALLIAINSSTSEATNEDDYYQGEWVAVTHQGLRKRGRDANDNDDSDDDDSDDDDSDDDDSDGSLYSDQLDYHDDADDCEQIDNAEDGKHDDVNDKDNTDDYKHIDNSEDCKHNENADDCKHDADDAADDAADVDDNNIDYEYGYNYNGDKYDGARVEASDEDTAAAESQFFDPTDHRSEKRLTSIVVQNKFLSWGVRCEVCDVEEDTTNNTIQRQQQQQQPQQQPQQPQALAVHLMKCQFCHVTFCNRCSVANIDHVGTVFARTPRQTVTCAACIHRITNQSDDSTPPPPLPTPPQCVLCLQPGGWLRQAYYVPTRQAKKLRNGRERKAESSCFLHGQLWCHNLCVFWNLRLSIGEDNIGMVNLTNILLKGNQGFRESARICALCGRNSGYKVKCAKSNCPGGPFHFHISCARAAGLQVEYNGSYEDEECFYVHCYYHSDSSYHIRARLEDLLDLESQWCQEANSLEDAELLPMTMEHASQLLHSAIRIMRMLGWTWRWIEWWWATQNNGGKMARRKAPKKTAGTKDGRCCHLPQQEKELAAIGMALRNREFDVGENACNTELLDECLRLVLCTEELVGYLQDLDVEFLVEWLQRAYRTKSRYLGFGTDKIPIAAMHEKAKIVKDQRPHSDVTPDGND